MDLRKDHFSNLQHMGNPKLSVPSHQLTAQAKWYFTDRRNKHQDIVNQIGGSWQKHLPRSKRKGHTSVSSPSNDIASAHSNIVTLEQCNIYFITALKCTWKGLHLRAVMTGSFPVETFWQWDHHLQCRSWGKTCLSTMLNFGGWRLRALLWRQVFILRGDPRRGGCARWHVAMEWVRAFWCSCGPGGDGRWSWFMRGQHLAWEGRRGAHQKFLGGEYSFGGVQVYEVRSGERSGTPIVLLPFLCFCDSISVDLGGFALP
jgi:hypothetical protein